MGLVTARYIGRLGNNMFQLAAAIGYARHYGYTWKSEPKNDEVPEWFSYFPNLPIGLARSNSYQCHAPNTFNYKLIPNQGSTRLMGFFQSEKYFVHCKEEVKEVFKLPVTIGYQDYCSIHVRRGDYVKYAAHFPPTSLNYLRLAMKEMKSRGVKKFIVCSDDINWCKKNMDGVEFSEGLNPFEDMALMASCGNHIITNSTFSWWAAYLGVNPDRHVISPSHSAWFGPKNGVTLAIGSPKDIIPDNWQQI